MVNGRSNLRETACGWPGHMNCMRENWLIKFYIEVKQESDGNNKREREIRKDNHNSIIITILSNIHVKFIIHRAHGI